MQIVVLVIGAFGVLLIGYVLYRYMTVSRQHKQINKLRFERIRPLYEKLEKGIYVSPDEVYGYAANILTRDSTYNLLQQYQQTEQFPAEFNNVIKAGESQLANWLEFPTELGKCPDEIEFIKQETVLGSNNADEKAYYQVFRFKVYGPHWAADQGWIMGVAGPYFDDGIVYGGATAFSRFVLQDKTTPQQEANWMHEHVTTRT